METMSIVPWAVLSTHAETLPSSVLKKQSMVTEPPEYSLHSSANFFKASPLGLSSVRPATIAVKVTGSSVFPAAESVESEVVSEEPPQATKESAIMAARSNANNFFIIYLQKIYLQQAGQEGRNGRDECNKNQANDCHKDKGFNGTDDGVNRTIANLSSHKEV